MATKQEEIRQLQAIQSTLNDIRKTQEQQKNIQDRIEKLNAPPAGITLRICDATCGYAPIVVKLSTFSYPPRAIIKTYCIPPDSVCQVVCKKPIKDSAFTVSSTESICALPSSHGQIKVSKPYFLKTSDVSTGASIARYCQSAITIFLLKRLREYSSNSGVGALQVYLHFGL